jgi:DNA-binding SARP family transcriptional activator/TolB-like protein
VYLRTLGPFSAAFDDTCTSPLRISTKKSTALVVYLAMSQRQVAEREHLAALLWGSSSEQQARQSLRQALVYLRKDLRPLELLQADSGTVRLTPGSIWVDALELEELAASSKFGDLERGASLARGEFLSGFNAGESTFDDWLRHQRRRLEAISAGVLEKFASQADLLGKHNEAIAAAERLLEMDPLREDWQRLALTIYARHRGRNEALTQAKAFAQNLKRELGVEPEPHTQEVVKQIERGDFPNAGMAVATSTGRDDPVTLGSDLQEMPVPPAAALASAATQFSDRLRSRAFPPLSVMAVLIGLLVTAAAALAGTILIANSNVTGTQTAAIPGPAIALDNWNSPRLSTHHAPRSDEPVISLAVLPLRTYENGADTLLTSEILTDDLINMLSRIGALRVISRQTSRSYLDRPLNIAAVRADLNVRYLLDGSVRVQGQKLRVHVELIDTASTFAVWSAGFERDGPNPQAVVDDVVRRLARELSLQTVALESQRLPDDTGTAQILYKGLATLATANRFGIEAFEKAQALFEQVLQRDPRNASALAGLGGVHASMAAQRYVPDPSAAFAKAETLLHKVLLERPTHVAANFYMGVVEASSGRPETGLEYFQRVVDNNPSHAPTHALMGHTLARMNKHAEGLEFIRYALRLSPKDPAQTLWLEFACNAELELGRLQDAIESCSRSAALNPTYARSWAGLAAAHALSGDAKGAHAAAEKLRGLEPHLSTDALIKRFGRGKVHGKRLPEGLQLALAYGP